MTDEQLIARLRDPYMDGYEYRAADRIKVLVKERDALISARDTMGNLWAKEKARAERLEEALLWCSGSADFNEGGVAREGWLKVCAPLLTGGKDE